MMEYESTRWGSIEKSAAQRTQANLTDYGRARVDFGWDSAARELAMLPGGGLNIAHEAVDRHLDTPLSEAPTLHWLRDPTGRVTFSYSDLAISSNRFAGVLRDLGVGRGARVCTLLGRSPELYIAALGTWKAGCIVSPLFSAFGPEPVRQRMALAGAEVLVTSRAHYRRKVAPIHEALPALRYVLITDAESAEADDHLVDLRAAMAAASPEYTIVRTEPEDAALLHFTSGTTGTPKGAVHVHNAVLAHRVTARYALDLRGGDMFWCTADPGWVTGMSYGVIAPLSLGATLVSDEAEFDIRRWYDILTAEGITVWYTSPTALRMLMRHGDALPPGTDLSRLRFIASVGEPLNPEVVVWGERALGKPVHDNWWQTETGAIMIANFAAEQVRPVSMGRPLPSIHAAILRRGPNGRALTRGGVQHADVDEIGELALHTGWPSVFREHWQQPQRSDKALIGPWYLSGDPATRLPTRPGLPRPRRGAARLSPFVREHIGLDGHHALRLPDFVGDHRPLRDPEAADD